MDKNQKFNLSVLAPQPDKNGKPVPGKVMFTTTRVADSVSKAVAAVRHEIEGSGWIVVQSAVLAKPKNEPEVAPPVITEPETVHFLAGIAAE